jgi:hypothetical protein
VLNGSKKDKNKQAKKFREEYHRWAELPTRESFAVEEYGDEGEPEPPFPRRVLQSFPFIASSETIIMGRVYRIFQDSQDRDRVNPEKSSRPGL